MTIVALVTRRFGGIGGRTGTAFCACGSIARIRARTVIGLVLAGLARSTRVVAIYIGTIIVLTWFAPTFYVCGTKEGDQEGEKKAFIHLD